MCYGCIEYCTGDLSVMLLYDLNCRQEKLEVNSNFISQVEHWKDTNRYDLMICLSKTDSYCSGQNHVLSVSLPLSTTQSYKWSLICYAQEIVGAVLRSQRLISFRRCIHDVGARSVIRFLCSAFHNLQPFGFWEPFVIFNPTSCKFYFQFMAWEL